MSNYKVIMPTHGVPIKAWVKGVPVETEAVDQLCNIASMPFIYKHVAVMPDVLVVVILMMGHFLWK